MMDDDFNTAGAIGVMHELAGAVNSFLEENKAETKRQPDVMQAASAGAQTVRRLGRLFGLFQENLAKAASQGAESGQVEELMKLMILLRNDARKAKNFAMADAVRDGLKKIGITLEDRPEGTGWRKD
jgi:cysteinyl-tRNA synthetase